MWEDAITLGGMSLFTTDGGHGYVNFASDPWRFRSPAYGQLFLGDQIVSLSAREMGSRRSVRYGVGYTQYQGTVAWPGGEIAVDQAFVATLNHDSGIRVVLRLSNLGPGPIRGVLKVAGDLASVFRQKEAESQPTLAPGLTSMALHHPTLGAIGIVADEEWRPGRQFSQLFLEREIELQAGQSVEAKVWVGYGNPIDVAAARGSLDGLILNTAQKDWKARLLAVDIPVPDQWIWDECIRATGQLLSFTSYDGATRSSYSALGGYGWRGFGIRESAENSLALAFRYSELAKDTLRWIAGLRFANGNHVGDTTLSQGLDRSRMRRTKATTNCGSCWDACIWSANWPIGHFLMRPFRIRMGRRRQSGNTCVARSIGFEIGSALERMVLCAFGLEIGTTTFAMQAGKETANR